MSALTDDISRHHWRLGVGHPDIDVCLCGWKQHRDNGQIGYNSHLIEVTEAAVREQIREQIAARIDAACELREHGPESEAAAARGLRLAARIARGE